MDENTTYRLSEITVNADELRRIKDTLDEQLAQGLALYRRVENLINQGTTTKYATKKEADHSGSQEDKFKDVGSEDIQRNRALQDAGKRPGKYANFTERTTPIHR